MRENENNNAIDPATEKEPDCKVTSDEKSKKDQKKKREDTIISTSVDEILSFFEVW